jgi:hypothetical protein
MCILTFFVHVHMLLVVSVVVSVFVACMAWAFWSRVCRTSNAWRRPQNQFFLFQATKSVLTGLLQNRTCNNPQGEKKNQTEVGSWGPPTEKNNPSARKYGIARVWNSAGRYIYIYIYFDTYIRVCTLISRFRTYMTKLSVYIWSIWSY